MGFISIGHTRVLEVVHPGEAEGAERRLAPGEGASQGIGSLTATGVAGSAPRFCLHAAGSGLVSAAMKRTLLYALASATLLTAAGRLTAAEAEEGFTPLCDGKTFNGWKMAEENKDHAASLERVMARLPVRD